MIFSLPNPIPYTVRDPEDLSTHFEKFGIIPYYGTSDYTSHGFLDLLTTITDLSPSFNTVLNDLKKYTFGLNIDFVGRSIPGLAIDDQDLDPDAKIAYGTFLSDLNIMLPLILKLSKRIDQHLAVCGNAYLKIRRVQEGDLVKYFLSVPHYKHVAYLKSRDAGERFLIVSKFLTDEQLMNKYPPLIVAATQAGDTINWNKTEKGVEEAVIHIKTDEDGDESDYYARPDILSVMTWLYVDFQLGNLNSKIAATELITKKIIAFEGPDPNTFDTEDDLDEIVENGREATKKLDRFGANMLVLKKLTTNLAGHPSEMGPGEIAGAIAGIEYPHGGHAPTTIDIEMNRDVAHQTWQANQANDVISSVMGWAPELTGMRKATSSLGGNLMYDLFVIKNASTIKPRQLFYQDFWNGVLAQICEREGGAKEFKGYGIKFPSVVKELVEMLGGKDTTKATETNPAKTVNQTGEDDTQDTANA